MPPLTLNNKKKIYLASPYGFSEHWKNRLLPDFINVLEYMGVEVWEPFSRNSQKEYYSTPRSGGNNIKSSIFGSNAKNIAKKDAQDVRDCDAIFAIINGCPPDEGVMVELGIAIALGKPTFLFRDDFRRCADSAEFPVNLMIFAGIPDGEKYDNYLYTSIDDIKNKNKALYRWINKENNEPVSTDYRSDKKSNYGFDKKSNYTDILSTAQLNINNEIERVLDSCKNNNL